MFIKDYQKDNSAIGFYEALRTQYPYHHIEGNKGHFSKASETKTTLRMKSEKRVLRFQHNEINDNEIVNGNIRSSHEVPLADQRRPK
jgi:hypothetical protein